MRTAVGNMGVGTRLLLATIAVVLVATTTAWVVVLAVGPGIFHHHMLMTGVTDPDVILHAEEAFEDASAVSVSIALMVALVTASGLGLVLTRRVTRSLDAVTDASRRVAAGDHDARVPDVRMGREFVAMADSFNAMAADLGEVESSRTRMLGDLAHEMRTPLATIDAHLEAISDGVRAADEETLAVLGSQVNRLARLAEDVALVTSAEEGGLSMRRGPLRIADVLEEARTHAAARYDEAGVDLEVRVTGAARSAVVDADGDRLGQVLTNLLDNARRHTPAGGRVTVTADVVGDDVRLEVADTGEGIAPEHLPHLFERFYRVDTARDRAHGGSGVGLAIVRAIMRAHGGTVTASSDGAGRGAVFALTLPVSPQRP
ncbi:MAG: sensor histidine kinase [Actinomycetota bacterium]